MSPKAPYQAFDELFEQLDQEQSVHDFSREVQQKLRNEKKSKTVDDLYDEQTRWGFFMQALQQNVAELGKDSLYYAGYEAALERYRQQAQQNHDHLSILEKIVKQELRDGRNHPGDLYSEGYLEGLYAVQKCLLASKDHMMEKIATQLEQALKKRR